MKKKLLSLAVALLSVFTLCALAACGEGRNIQQVVIDEQTSYVFTASSSVMELTDTTSVEDYLKALKEKGEITFEGKDSTYGWYITSVNGTAEQTVESTPNSYKGYAWNVFLDFTKLEGDNAIYGSDWSTCEYQGKTLYSASYGISSVPCVEGHTYALVYVYSESNW